MVFFRAASHSEGTEAQKKTERISLYLETPYGWALGKTC